MRSIPVAAAALVALAAFFLVLPEPAAPPPAKWPAQSGNSFVLRDVDLFDGERMLGRRDVLVRDGAIAAVSPRVPLPQGVPEFSADGHTLMPALIDAHTHNFGDARHDALRFGVGTQIDLFSNASLLKSARSERESMARTNQADLWSAGTLITATGGHGTQFGIAIPTLDRAEDADAFVAARIEEGSDFIKLVIESGRAWAGTMPTVDAETVAATIAAAHARGKRVVVHAGTADEARIAIEAGADGLAHAFGDAEASADLLAMAAAQDVFVVPTLTVMESIGKRNNGLLADAHLLPYLDAGQRATLGQGFPAGGAGPGFFGRVMANTAALHRAGVTILAGSDAPNPGTAHGASLHREIELLVEAGLSSAEALAAATSRVAERFGLEDRGRIATGRRADLILLAGNPLADITATRNIVAIWKNGYRIERIRQDASDRVSATTLENPLLGSFDDGDDGWVESTDAIRGGASTAAVAVENGVLTVRAEVRAGFMWPWAGVMRMLGDGPTAQVDLRGFERLHMRVRIDAPGTLLFFSGPPGGMPAQWPLTPGEGWQDIEVPLAEVAGFDAARAWGVAIVAGPQTGHARIDVDSVHVE